MERTDGRAWNMPRTHRIITDYVRTATGSCLIETGGTRVICTASAEPGVPPFLKGKNCGWLTAEYAMLPASTGHRKQRDGLKKDGRGVEISRLIGRVLRQAIDRNRMGEYTITIDCDVLEADGGTRTAAITGGFVALCCAIDHMIHEGILKESPIIHQIAAISAGVVSGEACLDLCYAEDSIADTDMNFVMNESNEFIELQGTGEGAAFSREKLDLLIDLGESGCRQLMACQREALGERAQWIGQKQKLVLASNNSHKIKELRTMLGDRYDVLSMNEAGFNGPIVENGTTFEENACIKAETVMHATGYLSLADDSGLSVEALDGAPGVHSARYAGEQHCDQDNNDLLMKNMASVPADKRKACFVSCIAIASPFKPTQTVRGECPGVITFSPRGHDGFGYDPYFEYCNGRTFAEMSSEEKNRISHRARAMEKALKLL
ncbi:MAG: ribonuclease PH [Clostridia bacterium]|nr:ribonuclease PH [Clostridia bacterium]